MTGYPPPNYGYGQPPERQTENENKLWGYPPQNYGYSSPSAPYGQSSLYCTPAPPYGSSPYFVPPYGAPSLPYLPSASTTTTYPWPSAPPYGNQDQRPLKEQPITEPFPTQTIPSSYQMPSAAAPFVNPCTSVLPSAFPPSTDPNIVEVFQVADRDRSGFIDDEELQRVLSSNGHKFSMRTVHLLMYGSTGSNTRKIGPKEFIPLWESLQKWRSTFERFDRDRSGKIDSNELREALLSLGFSISYVVIDLLVSKYNKSEGKDKAIEYDNFIQCCITVRGLTEKFKERDLSYNGTATFTYESFMLTVLPFLIA